MFWILAVGGSGFRIWELGVEGLGFMFRVYGLGIIYQRYDIQPLFCDRGSLLQWRLGRINVCPSPSPSGSARCCAWAEGGI